MEVTDDQLKDLVETTVRWADEVADLWVGTLYEKQIFLEKERLLQSIGDRDKTKTQVSDLAQFLNQAESEYERAGELQKVNI